MKAKEAPEKIILSADRDTQIINDDWVINDYTDDIKIKYIREDAFIEKLECWMHENFHFHSGEFAEGILAQFDRTEDAIDDFRKYMKGE